MTVGPMPENLINKLARTAGKPGVYLMKDTQGRIIYIGKARNLKKRLSSYFRKPGLMDTKTGVLIKKISTFETILTATEKEALILESNLIKRHKPRYNVILKDDKRYPSLRLDIKHPYPNLTIVRKTAADGALYFGPYTSSQAVRQTLNIIHKTFKLRRCKTRDFKSRSRPCINHQIGACLAPCCLDVSLETYQGIINEVILFLKGRTPALIQKIKTDMAAAAAVQDFENAAASRDKMFALEKTLEKQISVTTDFIDRDVLAVARASGESLIILLAVRSGYLLGKRHFNFQETFSTDAEMLGAFIRQYYEKTDFIPKEILVPVLPEDGDLIQDWLKGCKGQKVHIVSPQRGEKVRLVKMAIENAQQELSNLIASSTADMEMIQRLQKKLKLNRLPLRIECFDNSATAGRQPVAGMVVFAKGKPEKASYRKYKLKSVAQNNDYAYMAEVLMRRYGKKKVALPEPDMLMLDGGKGQLNIAIAVLRELGMDDKFDVVSIAKRDESKGEPEDKVYKPGRVNPVNFGSDDRLILFLKRIRDEAHRLAVSFHRHRRASTAIHSILDTIPGIGKKRKKILLKHFKSTKKIRAASPDEISALPGMNLSLAKAVQKALKI